MKLRLIKCLVIVGSLLAISGFYSKALAAPTIRSVSETTALTGTEPAGTAQGDLLIAYVKGTGTTTALTGPAGWTQVGTQLISWATPRYVGVWYIVRGSSSPSYTWTGPTGAYVVVTAWTGADTTNPINNVYSLTTATSSTPSGPSVTTTVNNSTMVTVAMHNDAAPTLNSYPTGMTGIQSNTTSRIHSASQVIGTAGATGTKQWSFSSSTLNALISFAIAPQSVTVGNTISGGNSYNYFYAQASINNQTANTIWYGARYGVGAGYSGTACASLPSTTGDYSTIGAGQSATYNVYVNASASTLYYFCVFAHDTTAGTYTYSGTTSSLTTSAIPAPAVQYPLVSTIDDASADVGIGVISYVSPVTVTARWGTSNVACASLPNSSVAISPGTDVNNSIAYTKRITGLSASTTYYWCFTAATTQGTTYSSVTSFATTAAAGTGCDLLPGSSLATNGDKTTLAGYLGTTKMQGTLLYKGTTNGWAASTFHTNANSQGATMVLVMNSANSKVFGGYNPQSWSSAGSYNYAPNGFLFSLSDGYQLKQTTANYQTYNSGTYGPTFGGGHDLGFPNATLNTAAAEYNNVSTYENPNTKGAFTYLNGGGTNTFTPSELEVYKISICTSAAPTVASPTKSITGSTTATLGGNITSGGTASVDARGICYAVTATNANPQQGGSGVTCTPEGGTTTGVFTQGITGLTANTTYSYTAYAHNSVGYGYTSADTFTTYGPPTVSTSAAGSVTNSSATLNSSVNPNGGSTNVSYLWGTTNASCSSLPNTLAGPSGLAGTSNVSPNATSLSSGLSPNTTYYFCVMAINSYGTSYGTVLNFTTSPTPGAYKMIDTGSVLGGGATDCDDTTAAPCPPVISSVGSATQTSLTVTWSASTGPTQTSYDLFWCDRTSNGSCTPSTQISNATSPYVHNSGPTCGRTYAYSVRANNASGASADSNVVAALTSNCVSSPSITAQGTSGTPGTTTTFTSSVNGNAASTTITYRYSTSNFACNSLGSTFAGTQTGFTGAVSDSTAKSGLTGNTTYYYCATATNSQGTTNGVSNGNANSIILTAPGAPTGGSATGASATQINVSWTAPAGGAASYNLKWCQGTSCTPSTTINGVTSTYPHTGLAGCGTTYRYIVTAVNATGSTDSAIFSGSTSSCYAQSSYYGQAAYYNYTYSQSSYYAYSQNFYTGYYQTFYTVYYQVSYGYSEGYYGYSEGWYNPGYSEGYYGYSEGYY